ncbi:MAG: bifunctional 2-polyprenyl-6-hydroxyphenol methylase/3-demethylubiquinol 3-O-methyltransferase UbiG [Desulfatitalea sp.]|nr:bifunctional 2-polyprenyl-6-hydroxyphenol methylase/3-demethylubiquinol 3-O-methyltransferase UbiG [Desulfatitalea sp.]
MKQSTPPNVDPREVAKFAAMAELWWRPEGEFKALHEINPVRLAYVAGRAAGLARRRVLDVGCGGGLLAEAMARQAAMVTGIDMVPEALGVARRHAAEAQVHVDYQEGSAEAWARTHPAAYDIVTCMELVEHVPDPASLVKACEQLTRPGGDIFFATVNRTPLAGLLVIGVAEYVLGIVRKGTHRYAKFVRPQELIAWGAAIGLDVAGLTGLRYLPFVGHARLCRSLKMNYMVHFKKR